MQSTYGCPKADLSWAISNFPGFFILDSGLEVLSELNNFLSGPTPPNSTKRKRLPPCPRRKKFGNAEYKINLTRREYNFFGTISSNVVFGCLKKANHEVDFGFFLIQSSEEKSISRSEPAPRRKTPLMPAPRLSTVVLLLDYRIHAIHFHR